MNALWNLFSEMLTTVNFDGLRCAIKGDPSIRDMMDALKRQKEIDRDTNNE